LASELLQTVGNFEMVIVLGNKIVLTCQGKNSMSFKKYKCLDLGLEKSNLLQGIFINNSLLLSYFHFLCKFFSKSEAIDALA
jgi:hypothetical protein